MRGKSGQHVLGDDDGIAEEAREDAELDSGGEERPVRSDQAARERDREQEDRPGGLHDESPRLATDLLRLSWPIFRGPGHREDKGTVAADEGAGENRDVHVRREGTPLILPFYSRGVRENFAVHDATFDFDHPPLAPRR